GGHESSGSRRAQRADQVRAGAFQRDDFADRAPNEDGHEHLPAADRAGLRADHRRRPAGGSAQQPAGAGGVPGQRGGAGMNEPKTTANNGGAGVDGPRSVATGGAGMDGPQSVAIGGAAVRSTAAGPAGAPVAGPGEPLLVLDDVHVSYGNIKAVRGISMEVYEGEIVTLVGANGAGKTTTLRAISRLIPIAQGSMRFRGVDLTKMPAHQVVPLGICHVPEGRGVFANLTVLENLMLATYSRKDRSRLS